MVDSLFLMHSFLSGLKCNQHIVGNNVRSTDGTQRENTQNNLQSYTIFPQILQLTTLEGISASVSMSKEEEEEQRRAGKPSSFVFTNLKTKLENRYLTTLLSRVRQNQLLVGKGRKHVQERTKAPDQCYWNSQSFKQKGQEAVGVGEGEFEYHKYQQ